ncbi:hypothetical protein RUM43_010236, partial [Polyplax serrata]
VLSRPHIEKLDSDSFAAAQRQDPELQQYLRNNSTGLSCNCALYQDPTTRSIATSRTQQSDLSFPRLTVGPFSTKSTDCLTQELKLRADW